VAIVDVFDTLTHERPYKPAWPVADAVTEVVGLRGRQFDPNVVDAFLRLDAHALASLGDHAGHARRLAAAAGA
jgi:HD-GYP domain-containing protein (c-di-GMP phosphodiesterase class II)